MDAIFNRRSIRKYKEQAVEQEKIDKILRAAMQAPSAVNQQPWEFIVVQDKENLRKLAELSPYSKMVAEAPLAIVVLGNEDRMRYKHHWEQDLGAATQNILLEAAYLGLGAVWLGVAPIEDRMDYIRNIFGLGKKLKPFCVIPIGYPAEGQENKFVDRYDPSKVHYEKY
ncbi:nitroreductase [Herbinix hemicellulosilytica]|uniref:Nitroreductase domain-containing protein n=1 Tax=Herbinix hemicellulosilytica TaxID=1564487 RepID=A0A0H5SIJ8_HERHM|nr:nitroreductase family protein [Herbinix hemicellulosilytica]RBP59230.1 nitroreductase [Herbinix hemicellulosilytica]CRZ35327.1 hypothetical protein HHT355_2129 [Herbinix hemicellulosilytica]